MSKFIQYLEECDCGGKCKCSGKCKGDCDCKDKAYTKDELAKKLKIDPSEIKTNSVKGKMDLWIVDGKTYKKA